MEEKFNPFNEENKQQEEVIAPVEDTKEETPEPVMEPEHADTHKSSSNSGSIAALWVGVILIALSVGALFFMLYSGKIGAGQKTEEPAKPIVPISDKVTIAYINTDTLMANYEYAKEVQRKMEQLTAQQASLAQQEAQFQQDYQNYLQTGENLTLSQQQEKEKELKARYEKLQRLEKQFTDLLPQKQKVLQDEMDKMTRAVYNFIADYNKRHNRYTYILSKSYSSSPVLYGDPALDITNEILDGLNAEYALVQANKEN